MWQKKRRVPQPTGGDLAMVHTPEFPSLLEQLGITLALTTYQAGLLILVSPRDSDSMIQLSRSFPRAMALDVSDQWLALSTFDGVERFRKSEKLGPTYPNQPETYAGIYVPHSTVHTGPIDCHGIARSEDEYWIVNTRFNALCRLSPEYSFEYVWKPPFVSELVPEDRCHLNGFALQDGKPKYVTCMGTGDSAKAWRGTIPDGGVLVDVKSSEIVAGDLQMPHSPVLVGDELYLALSATGEVVRMDVQTGKYDVVIRLNNFLRGMTTVGDYLFVAGSRIRTDSSSFRALSSRGLYDGTGVAAIHLPTGNVAGVLSYQAGVDEIFDVKVISGTGRNGIAVYRDRHAPRAVGCPEGEWWVAGPPKPQPGALT